MALAGLRVGVGVWVGVAVLVGVGVFVGVRVGVGVHVGVGVKVGVDVSVGVVVAVRVGVPVGVKFAVRVGLGDGSGVGWTVIQPILMPVITDKTRGVAIRRSRLLVASTNFMAHPVGRECFPFLLIVPWSGGLVKALHSRWRFHHLIIPVIPESLLTLANICAKNLLCRRWRYRLATKCDEAFA
jgi:hypothetical protein